MFYASYWYREKIRLVRMEYQQYTTDDFIKDERFQKWVYDPDTDSTTFWEKFLCDNPLKHRQIEKAVAFLKMLEFREEDIFESRISNLKNRIDLSIDNPETQSSPVSASPVTPPAYSLATRFWLSVAAVFFIISLVGLAIFKMANHERWEVGMTTLHEQSTSNGQRTVITLDDGTRVWLNAASRLLYPKTFSNQKIRKVFLDGEGFFDVEEDSAKSFVVQTTGIMIKVLGTSFNVRSYDRDVVIQTTLIKGSVAIESLAEDSEKIVLAPNQTAAFDKTTRKISLDMQTDPENYTGWKDGKLVFDDRPLSDIIVALERWYNVEFTVAQEVSLECHFSAKIDNLTLTEVLELFKASDGIDYRINGNRVFMTGSTCEN